MPSANGFKLEGTTRAGTPYSLVAYWPAPYFVLCGLDGAEGEKPILYHAECLEHAQRFQACGGGYLLNADFSIYESLTDQSTPAILPPSQ